MFISEREEEGEEGEIGRGKKRERKRREAGRSVGGGEPLAPRVPVLVLRANALDVTTQLGVA